MNRAVGTWLSILACAHLVALSSPAVAQPQTRQTDDAEAAGAPQDLVAKGRKQFDDQEYEDSIQTLSAALVRPGNTKAQQVEIYRLLALDYITLGRDQEADAAVRGLLVAKPDYRLPEAESPRFRDFFDKARAKWEAEGRPGLMKETPRERPITLKHAAPAEAQAGKTIDLRAKLDDPNRRAGSVKVYFRAGSRGDFESAFADVDDESVHAQIPGSAVKAPLMEYYLEVLDAAGAVLASRGDSQSPLRIAVPDESSGWVLPVAIGGGILGAAAIVGGLALAGVFTGSSGGGGGGGRGTSNVSISVGEAGVRF